MKKLLTICILLASLVGYSQSSYIGLHLGPLKKEFHNLTKDRTVEGDFTMYYVDCELGRYVFAVRDNTVQFSVLNPNDESRNLLIKFYNENYIKTSPRTWETYVDGGAINVELVLYKGGWQFNYKPL